MEVADGRVTSGETSRMLEPQRNGGKEGQNMTLSKRWLFIELAKVCKIRNVDFH